jgi:hypothetical protein
MVQVSPRRMIPRRNHSTFSREAGRLLSFLGFSCIAPASAPTSTLASASSSSSSSSSMPLTANGNFRPSFLLPTDGGWSYHRVWRLLKTHRGRLVTGYACGFILLAYTIVHSIAVLFFHTHLSGPSHYSNRNENGLRRHIGAQLPVGRRITGEGAIGSRHDPLHRHNPALFENQRLSILNRNKVMQAPSDTVQQHKSLQSLTASESTNVMPSRKAVFTFPVVENEDMLDEEHKAPLEYARRFGTHLDRRKRALKFFHIPKTAGTAIEYAAGAIHGLQWGSCLFNHRPKREICQYPQGSYEWYVHYMFLFCLLLGYLCLI